MVFSVSWSDHGAPPPIIRNSGIPKFAVPSALIRRPQEAFMPIYLMKTKLVLAGKSKAEIVQATASALDKKELPALEPGAMCYMMSKQPVSKRSGHELASTPDVFRSGRRGEKLGSRSGGLAGSGVR